MSFSGRYPEQDICENFNAIDVRELQRKTRLRPGLCFIQKWVRNGAPAGEVFIFTQPDAIILVYRARRPGATESRIVDLQVPIIWTKCRFGGRRPWFIARRAAIHRRVGSAAGRRRPPGRRLSAADHHQRREKGHQPAKSAAARSSENVGGKRHRHHLWPGNE